MRITTILWDIDGTLLDFRQAERIAIRQCLAHFALPPCTDEQIAHYAEINHAHWKRIEAGETTKAVALVARFRDFFEAEGIPFDRAAEFNAEYQLRLGETVAWRDCGRELVESLRGRIVQAAATNGTPVAQHMKLRNSGLDRLLDAVFISEEVGAEKPSRAFFDHALKMLGNPGRDTVVIIGDSLTSDIAGGINAGIHTVWYNPFGADRGSARPEFEISNLSEVPALLGL